MVQLPSITIEMNGDGWQASIPLKATSCLFFKLTKATAPMWTTLCGAIGIFIAGIEGRLEGFKNDEWMGHKHTVLAHMWTSP